MGRYKIEVGKVRGLVATLARTRVRFKLSRAGVRSFFGKGRGEISVWQGGGEVDRSLLLVLNCFLTKCPKLMRH